MDGSRRRILVFWATPSTGVLENAFMEIKAVWKATLPQQFADRNNLSLRLECPLSATWWLFSRSLSKIGQLSNILYPVWRHCKSSSEIFLLKQMTLWKLLSILNWEISAIAVLYLHSLRSNLGLAYTRKLLFLKCSAFVLVSSLGSFMESQPFKVTSFVQCNLWLMCKVHWAQAGLYFTSWLFLFSNLRGIQKGIK